MNLLKCRGITQESHVTRFCDNLLAVVDGLEKRLINNKLVVYFNSRVDNLLREQYTNPTAYPTQGCSHLCPKLHQEIRVLIDGVTITNEVFSQAALASAQQIMFNFRINQSKDMENFRRHLQFRETPVAIYTTLKLCVDKIKNTY